MRKVAAIHVVVPMSTPMPLPLSVSASVSPPMPVPVFLVFALLAISATGCVGRSTGTCGNAIRDGAETCDSTDLNSHVCLSQGFHGGTLACSSDCRSFDISGCCMNDCTQDMETQCDGDLHLTCKTQENGCLGWSETDCAAQSRRCFDYGSLALCVGTCEDDCDFEGDTDCTANVLRTCTWIGACLKWVDTDCFPVECGGEPSHCVPSPAGRACDDAYSLDGVTFPHQLLGQFASGQYANPPSCSTSDINPLYLSYTIEAAEPALVTAQITDSATSITFLTFPTLAAYTTNEATGICDPAARTELACHVAVGTGTSAITFDARDVGLHQGDVLYLLANGNSSGYPLYEPVVDLRIVDCAAPTQTTLTVPPTSIGVPPSVILEITFDGDAPLPNVGTVELLENATPVALYNLADAPPEVTITDRHLTVSPGFDFELGTTVQMHLNLVSAACANTIDETLSFTIANTAPPSGENCTEPIPLAGNGTTPIYWSEGNQQDVLNSWLVPCYPVSLVGNDSVFTFTMDATATKALITIPKSPQNHMVAVVLDACDTFADPVACQTNFTDDTLVLDAQNLEPGRQYYLAVGALTASDTFPDPHFTEIDIHQYFTMNLIDEPFDTWPTPGWTIEDLGATGSTWEYCAICTYNQYFDGSYMYVGYGYPIPYDAPFDDSLISPTFATHGFSAVYAEFNYDFHSTHGVEAHVEYSVDGGPWTLAQSLEDPFIIDYFISVLLPGAGYRNSVQVRFRYVSQEWDHDWTLDNVKVVGVP